LILKDIRYPQEEVVYICVDIGIVGCHGVYFTDGNLATGHTGPPYSRLEDLERIDWKTVMGDPQKKFNEKLMTRMNASVTLSNGFQNIHMLNSLFSKSETNNLKPDDEALISMFYYLGYRHGTRCTFGNRRECADHNWEKFLIDMLPPEASALRLGACPSSCGEDQSFDLSMEGRNLENGRFGMLSNRRVH
jgi:hypothetical protein